ncbi:MAG: hypothetical protein U9P38_08725, partial [Campylobacterota bacterium]|nr:hypothetical protein [Campylobacterota bacterium]
MKINKNSIIFKVIFQLLLFFTLFIVFIAIASKEIFSSAYMNLERDKISIIEENITPSLALNISYGFSQAVEEITKQVLNNPNILLLKIKTDEFDKDLICTKHKQSIETYREDGEFISKTDLIDPSTSQVIGEMLLVYSKASYDKYMQEFYSVFL